MGTRSFIVRKVNGGYEYIYCHYDGYPQHQLPILAEHYNHNDYVEQLFAQGNMSTLGKTIASCVFYHRDYKESKERNEASVTPYYNMVWKEAKESRAQYLYYWNGNRWLYAHVAGHSNNFKGMIDDTECETQSGSSGTEGDTDKQTALSAKVSGAEVQEN